MLKLYSIHAGCTILLQGFDILPPMVHTPLKYFIYIEIYYHAQKGAYLMKKLRIAVLVLSLLFVPVFSFAGSFPQISGYAAAAGVFTPSTIRKVELFFKINHPNASLYGVWNASPEGLKRAYTDGKGFFRSESGYVVLLWNGHICLQAGNRSPI